MAGFIFGGNTGETPESLKRKREIANALAMSAVGHAPRNIGEGLSSIGQALAYRAIAGKADKAAAAGQESANAAFNPIVAALGGGGAFPAAPGSPQPSNVDVPTQRVASAFGDQPGPANGYFDAIRSAESGGSDNAKNPLSSATGRYQFTKGTWDGLMTAHPELGLTPDGRTDPSQQERAIRVFTAQNANQLQDAGIQPTGGNLYAAHFLGADGAKNVLTQPDSATVSSFVGPEVVKANPFLKGMTVGQFKQWAASKGGGDAPVAFSENVPAESSVAMSAPPTSTSDQAPNGAPGQLPDAEALKLLGASPVTRDAQGGPSIAMLLRSAANPWLSKNQSAVVSALLQEKLKQQDPTTQLDMRYKQAQLNNLLHPQAKPTGDMQEYEFAKSQGFNGSLQDWLLSQKKAGATTINNNPDGAMFAGMPKDVREEMFKRQGEAQDSADLINVTNQGLQLLDQGAITGAGSGAKVAAVKWAQTLGVPVPDDIASAANNTDTYRSIMAKAVGKVIKNFGSGTGLSDADRQYAERLAGGDTTLNEPAIRRILAAGAKQAQQKIDAFGTMRDKVLKGDLGAMLNVNEPQKYTPPAGAPKPGQVEDGYRFKGGNPSDPNSWEPVQ